MNIKINKIKLQNFKGIKSLELDLKDDAFIYGDNGTGKTTIFDAFVWLLFGKDSTDRSQFEIKTLDENNEVIPKIDHVVEAVLDVDDEDVKLSKTFKEKWVTQRGSKDAVFKGHETIYEWNDVPMKAVDYQKKISEIIDEKIFKLITSPYAFNSLKWEDQRNTLINICGNITNESVAEGVEEYKELLQTLKGKSIKEYKDQLKSSISKSKKQIKSIPDRIDEVDKNKPEALNFKVIGSDLEAKQEKLKDVDAKIEDAGNYYDQNLQERKKLKEDKAEVENKIIQLRTDLKDQAQSSTKELSSKLEELKRQKNQLFDKLNSTEREFNDCNRDVDEYSKKLKQYDDQMDELRDKYKEKANESISFEDGDELSCPTCGRAFEGEDLEDKKAELTSNYNKERSKELERISDEGKTLKKQKERLNDKLQDVYKRRDDASHNIKMMEEHHDQIVNDINEIGSKLDQQSEEWQGRFDELLDNSDQLKKLNQQKTDIEDKLQKLQDSYNAESEVRLSSLKSDKQELTDEIDKLKNKLYLRSEIERADKRITELKDEESELANTIAEYESGLLQCRK